MIKSRAYNIGMTLIEVIIYTVLLSFLMAGFIQYAYAVNINNIQLINEIQDQ
jgi:Tfp pilus assembly protein PilV